jgi:hypothetical protein
MAGVRCAAFFARWALRRGTTAEMAQRAFHRGGGVGRMVSVSGLVTTCLKASSSSGMTRCCKEPGDVALDVFTKLSVLGAPTSGSKTHARAGENGDRGTFETVGLAAWPSEEAARLDLAARPADGCS